MINSKAARAMIKAKANYSKTLADKARTSSHRKNRGVKQWKKAKNITG